MKRILGIIACCILLLGGYVYADFESEVIDLVNIERDAEGLPPLSYDADLASAARGHSEDMGLQNYFSHTGLDGRTPCDRMTDAGYSWNYCGENIAAGQPTPEDVIDAWMASSGHRANILNPNFCDIGVGYAYVASSTYGHYWTQNFGRRSGVSSCPEIVSYTITATAGTGGSIAPQGNVEVDQGSDITFTITPDAGYSVTEVLVDGETKAIATTYTFSNVSSNHTLAVNFALNQLPPTANAGPDQDVIEGATVALDGSQSSDPNDAIVTYEWTQTSGPAIALSDTAAVKPTFVAAPITEDVSLVFQLTVYDSGGDSDSDTVTINITDNGIQTLPADTITFQTTTNSILGLQPDGDADLVSLQPVDPDDNDITNRNGMPQDMIYGLMDIKVKVDIPGSSTTVTVLLPEPVPQGYKWYKYSPSQGWYDYSANVTFNGDRTQLSITLVDGGTGDDDGEQNGIIDDPSGLGAAPAGSVSSGGGGAGGCFIDTLRSDFTFLSF
ncbi:MAG: CAP domain-containing protein [Desulfobacterales bacterium]